MELRLLDETKGHLHCLADDLKDALWAACDEARDAADQERTAVVEDVFVGDHCRALVTLFGHLMQQETSRFQTTSNVLRDFFTTAAGSDLEDEVPEPHNALAGVISALEEAGEGEVEEGSILKPTDVGMFACLETAVGEVIEKLCVTPEAPAVPEPAEGGEEEGAAAEPEADGDIPGLFAAMRVEEKLLRDRLVAVKARCMEMMLDFRQREATLHAKMDEMIGVRFRTEVDAIQTLITTIKTAIEKHERIYHEIRISQADLMVDHNSLTYTLYTPPPPPPPREILEKWQLSTNQILNLILMLKELGSSSSIITVSSCVRIFQQAAAHSASKVLPHSWLPLLPSQLTSLVKLFDRPGCGMVDWRRIVLALCSLSAPTMQHTSSILSALSEQGIPLSNSVDAKVAAALPWWFAKGADSAEDVDTDG
jgi:hypothetical protein